MGVEASSHEKDIAEYYESTWSDFVKWMKTDKSLGLHFGYYEKGIRTYEEAVINMNYFVGRLLDLDTQVENNISILDIGCGVGGSSIYLAKKYPHFKFIGITIVLEQVYLAKKFAREKHVSSNTEFILGNYLKTGVVNNYFDGAFAIESACHAEDKKEFLLEAYRILKPNKKLVVVDGFLTKKPSNYFIQAAYDFYRKVWVIPHLEVIDDFTSNLEDIGFGNIKLQDISKNVSKAIFISNLKSLAYILYIRMKKKSDPINKKPKSEKRRITKNPIIYITIMIFAPILIALAHTIRYMAITSVKIR